MIDKESGTWLLAVSYANDEARDRGLRNGYMPRYRYIQKRIPEIYEELENKTYKYVKLVKD